MEIVRQASFGIIVVPRVVFLLPLLVGTTILLSAIYLVLRTGRRGSMRLFIVLGGVAASLWAWWFLSYVLGLFFFFDFENFTSLEPILWAGIVILTGITLYLLWLTLGHIRRDLTG